MKLSPLQKAIIVENDPIAVRETRTLWERVDRKEITAARAGRLMHNIAGQAIRRWRSAQPDLPYQNNGHQGQ